MTEIVSQTRVYRSNLGAGEDVETLNQFREVVERVIETDRRIAQGCTKLIEDGTILKVSISGVIDADALVAEVFNNKHGAW